MTENEVVDLLEEIESVWTGRIRVESPAARFNAFYRLLKNKDSEMVFENLVHYMENSDGKYPPEPRDLLRKREFEEKSTVPSFKETQEYLARYQDLPEPDEESLKAMEEAKAAIRKMLDIEKGAMDDE